MFHPVHKPGFLVMNDTKKVTKANKVRPKFDREELVQLMVCDILNGMSRYRVQLKLKRDQYEGFESSKYSRSKQYDLIQEAYNNCKPQLEKDRQKQREMFIARYEDILEEARNASDRQNAIAALKEMGKILGVYDPENVNITADLKVDVSFGLEDETELQD